MAKPSISDLKLWVGTLLTKDDWDFNFTKIVGWLANGESDLVVNSLKASNGIDLNGSNISNLAPATTGSQAVTYDQAQTLLNRTSYYTPFSIASGKVDSSGNAAYLQKDSDTQVTILAGNVNPDLVVIQSDGTVESITSNVVLTVGTTDDTYYIVKEKSATPTITSGSVTIGKTYPTSPVAGDYFLNTSVEPFAGYKYDSQSGWVSKEFCLLGSVVVSSGTATVNTLEYNVIPDDKIISGNITSSGTNTFSGNNTFSNTTTFSGAATFSGTVTLPSTTTSGLINAVMPDYANGVSKSWNTGYQADTDGWLFVRGYLDDNKYFQVRVGTNSTASSNNVVAYTYIVDVNNTAQMLVPVPKDYYYYIDGSGTNSSTIWYPCKGV